MGARSADADVVQAALERNTADLLAYFARRAAAEDAADMFGDTLLVVSRRATDLPHDPTEARMWLFGVARHTVQNHRRSQRRRSALQGRLVDELGAGGEALTDRVVNETQAAITSLKDLDQEIVRLVYWDGFSLAEVARLLGRPEGTVRSRHHRARQQLRTQLQNGGATSPADRAPSTGNR